MWTSLDRKYKIEYLYSSLIEALKAGEQNNLHSCILSLFLISERRNSSKHEGAADQTRSRSPPRSRPNSNISFNAEGRVEELG